jgi:hypothetical protein
MGWVPETVIEALRGSHVLGIFFRMDTQPEPLRLWFGVNDIPLGILGVDPDTSQTYLGGGRLQNIPYLEVLLNGAADRVEFTLSGIDPDASGLAQVELPPVRGAEVHVGITTLDDHYQPMSSIIPLLQGAASFTTEKSEPVEGTSNVTITMGLSVGFGSVTRSRQSEALWSSAQHRAIYPTDAFCDGTARLARGVAPVWPRF